MTLFLASISHGRSRSKMAATDEIVGEYVARTSRFLPCTSQVHSSEAAFLAWLDRAGARTAPFLILLDRGGKQLSSEDFATTLGRLRDAGTQTVVLAVGPADGWSATSRARPGIHLSLGLITLPHEIARVVLAEQIYRATTILAGHPYHSGH